MQRVISTGGKRNAQRPENEHSEMIDECTRNVFYRIHWWEYVSVSREANNFFINQHDWKTANILDLTYAYLGVKAYLLKITRSKLGKSISGAVSMSNYPVEI